MLAHSPSIVLNGLVLCLDAGNTKSYDSSTSLTAWNDLSGNSYNSVLENMDATNYSSSNGGFLTFDGSNERVNINSNYKSFTNYNQQITVEAWINVPTGANISEKPIVMRDGDGTNDYGLRTSSDGKIQAYFGINIPTPTTSISLSPTPLTTNVWYQLNAVWSGTSALYINGALVATNSQTLSGNTDNNSTMKIASFITNPYFNVRVSAVKIYNRALSAAEISQNFNALRGRFGI